MEAAEDCIGIRGKLKGPPKRLYNNEQDALLLGGTASCPSNGLMSGAFETILFKQTKVEVQKPGEAFCLF